MSFNQPKAISKISQLTNHWFADNKCIFLCTYAMYLYSWNRLNHQIIS